MPATWRFELDWSDAPGYACLMRIPAWCFFLRLGYVLHQRATSRAPQRPGATGKPACIGTSKLAGFDGLPEDRKKLIQHALALATHVAMYLGVEKSDNRPVMINSTDGRSYRGVKANGYGVYDFHLPEIGAAIRFLGYGTPPGILEF